MRKILCLLFCLSFVSLYGQRTTLKGKVTDTFNKPMPGVTVYTQETRKKPVYTDTQGRFIIKNVFPDQLVYFGFPGYPEIMVSRKVADMDKENSLLVVYAVRGKTFGHNRTSLEGLTVEIEGRPKSKTVTEENGYFYLAPIAKGEKLVISDPQSHWETQVVPVDNPNNWQDIYMNPAISPLLAHKRDTLGITYLSDNTPVPESDSIPEVKKIKSFSLKNNLYKINTLPDRVLKGHEVNFSTSAGISVTARLPELQSEYAQGATNGSSLQWEGADKNQIFSWGPRVSELEFNGVSYPYDKNGPLVTRGTGNGIGANTYDATDFFRTGSFFENTLRVEIPLFGKQKFAFSLGQHRTNSPVPNAYSDRYNASVKLEDIKTGLFRTTVYFSGSTSRAHLMNNGASYARLLQSVLTTPVTFDNANGLSSGKAADGNVSWQLADGSQRSYAPDHIRNPFYYVNTLPDKNKTEKILTYIKTGYWKPQVQVNASVGFNKQWEDRTIGMDDPFPRSVLTRTEHLSDLTANLDASYIVNKAYNKEIKINAAYFFDRTDEKVKRNGTQVYNGFRNAHTIKYGVSFSKRALFVEAANKHYFSNTITDYVHLAPYAGLNLNLDNFFEDELNCYVVNSSSLFASVNRSKGEAPLIYRNPAILSTTMSSSSALQSFYEDREISSFTKKTDPEVYTNMEAGIRGRLFHSELFLEFSYFNTTTWDMIAPVNNGNDFGLGNIGRVRNSGYLIATSYNFGNFYYRDAFRGWVNLNINIARSKVTAVSGGKDRIPLAGFTNVGTYFAKNESLGAIYGTTYLRSENNELIIGEDGFPLVDSELKKIGDPTPDFILNFSPNFQWNRFLFSFLFEYNHGGDKWNGTQAYLDYTGMSKKTAEQRNVKGYIYDGRTQSGEPNSTTVDFYNPSLPLTENRWVRYGTAGVGEEYIQDASYLRLSSVSLSYDILDRRNYRFIKKLTATIQAQNLFLITSYKGSDPSSTLFGYATGRGLDLFNMPATRNYQLTVTIEL